MRCVFENLNVRSRSWWPFSSEFRPIRTDWNRFAVSWGRYSARRGKGGELAESSDIVRLALSVNPVDCLFWKSRGIYLRVSVCVLESFSLRFSVTLFTNSLLRLFRSQKYQRRQEGGWEELRLALATPLKTSKALSRGLSTF